MIILITILFFTFDTSSCLCFPTDKALMSKPFFLNILNSTNINSSIFFLKIALWNPNCTHIMNPNIMTCRLIWWICGSAEIIVIKLFLFLFFFYLSNFRRLFFLNSDLIIFALIFLLNLIFFCLIMWVDHLLLTFLLLNLLFWYLFFHFLVLIFNFMLADFLYFFVIFMFFLQNLRIIILDL